MSAIEQAMAATLAAIEVPSDDDDDDESPTKRGGQFLVDISPAVRILSDTVAFPSDGTLQLRYLVN